MRWNAPRIISDFLKNGGGRRPISSSFVYDRAAYIAICAAIDYISGVDDAHFKGSLVTTEDLQNKSAQDAEHPIDSSDTPPDHDDAPATLHDPLPDTDETSPQDTTTATITDDDVDQLIEDKVKTAAEATASEKGDVIEVPRIVFNYLIIAIVFFGIGMVAGSFAFPSTQQATLPEDFEAVVRGAVADVMADAGIQVQEEGLQEGEIYEIAYDEDDPFLGNPDGSIVIVEFSDFLCGFCGRFASDTLPLLLEEYGDDIRFVYRDFPVIQPQASPVIALAAECAQDQGKFWEYHDLLFANTSSISSTDVLFEFADELELDNEQFTNCFENGEHFEEIQEDEAYARELGLRGTPGFFINGRFVNGAVPIETFREVIDEELASMG